MLKLIYALFFLSGFAGLVYEATWARYLKLFLGHSSYGQILTICIYMGGLGIGSFIASRISSKIKSLLLAYAITELAIAIGGLFYHDLYLLKVEYFSNLVLNSSFSPLQAEMIKLLLSVAITGPMAILLGMTFPFVANGLVRLQSDGGRISFSLLYFTNSLGAAAGILVASYFLIPWFGNPGTLVFAAIINILICIAFIIISIKSGEQVKSTPTIFSNLIRNSAEMSRFSLKGHARLWLIIAFLTGLTSFIYEVAWIRLLSLMMGSSTHSFDIMISAFVFGLAMGAWFSRKWMSQTTDYIRMLSLVQLFMGFCAMLTIYLYEPFFIMMNESNQIFGRTESGYAAWNLFKYLLSLLWMVPTSFFAGMTLPVITFFLSNAAHNEKYTGSVYGWNTLGSISGMALGGLVLLPWLQLRMTIAVAALFDMLTGLVLLIIYRYPEGRNLKIPAFILLACLPLLLIRFDPLITTSGVFRYYTDDSDRKEKVIIRDGRTATISFHENFLQKYIKTNGKTDASISKFKDQPVESDQLTQGATAFMPMATKNSPYTAAFVGFGSGMSAQYFLSDPLLTKIDIIEIEKEMYELARGFQPDNIRPYTDPRANIHFDDARTFFQTHNHKYDVIVSVPSNPWVSGVSALFTHEFYTHIRKYLTETGVLVQWLQLYEFSDELLIHILKALEVSFPHVAIYQVPGEPDIIIMASESIITQQYIDRFKETPSIYSDFQQMKRPWDFFGEHNYVASLKSVAPVLKNAEPNSDFYPLVDNQAELARFAATESNLFANQGFIQLSYSMLFDAEVYTQREKLMEQHALRHKPDPYRLKSMRFILEDADTSLNWLEIYRDFKLLTNPLPFSPLRDTLYEYQLMKNAVENEIVTDIVAAEFWFWDHLLYRRWNEAVQYVPILMDMYKLHTLDAHIIRAMIITAYKTGSRKLMVKLYEQGVRPNENFQKGEREYLKVITGAPEL
jgi:spermidine synthase